MPKTVLRQNQECNYGKLFVEKILLLFLLLITSIYYISDSKEGKIINIFIINCVCISNST